MATWRTFPLRSRRCASSRAGWSGRGSGARRRPVANGLNRRARRATRSAMPKLNDPSTWGSYADALAAVAAGKADGIGYMLSTSDIAAGDLDHCVDPDNRYARSLGDQLEAEANGAYREITVSGKACASSASQQMAAKRTANSPSIARPAPGSSSIAILPAISPSAAARSATAPSCRRWTASSTPCSRATPAQHKHAQRRRTTIILDRLRRGDQERRAGGTTVRTIPGGGVAL